MATTFWIGTRKGLFQLSRSTSGQWNIDSSHFLGVQVPMLVSGPAGLFAALQHGHFGSKVQRSNDGGASWTEIGVPTYPPKPDDVPDVIDPMRNKAIPWSLELIWSMEMTSAGKLWCGTLPGGLFSSDDQGDSWDLNWPLWNLPNRSHWFGGGYDVPGIHSVCIDPRDEQQIKVGISCGGVWASDDGGASWQCRADGMRAEYVPPERAFDPDIQDPHRVVQCVGAPDHHWVQHHNGIFKSTDNCQHWEELKCETPSSFGFVVTVHPQDPHTAWFVPAIADSDRFPKDGQFVVTRTRDGGQTFDVLTSGLPQADAYHLVYRHALEVDMTGEVLAMGSTTGGLWISEDAGDSWQLVTQDLPPIFVIRNGTN